MTSLPELPGLETRRASPKLDLKKARANSPVKEKRAGAASPRAEKKLLGGSPAKPRTNSPRKHGSGVHRMEIWESKSRDNIKGIFTLIWVLFHGLRISKRGWGRSPCCRSFYQAGIGFYTSGSGSTSLLSELGLIWTRLDFYMYIKATYLQCCELGLSRN